MKFKRLSLQHFRNVDLQHLNFEGDRVFLLGKNGQGKSNILEALGYVSALRSFRVHETSALVQYGKKEAVVLAELEHEHLRDPRLEIRLAPGSKRVVLDGERVGTLSSMIGRFPTVTLSSEDLELLRGAPGRRRQFLDLLISSLDPEYLRSLKRYSQALKSRNQLLKEDKARGMGPILSAFEEQMAGPACFLVDRRNHMLKALFQAALPIYNEISGVEETPMVSYKPNLDVSRLEDFRKAWRDSFEKDRAFGATRLGPHRDDFSIHLLGRRARAYASEGQKRGLVTAIKLAECRLLQDALRVTPVLLADDIVGELDPDRRKGLWNCLREDWQVIATGTELPDDRFKSWTVFDIENGHVKHPS